MKELAAAIDALNVQIQKLTEARDTLVRLQGPDTKKTPTMSADARKRIAEAQRKRWAEQKKRQRALASVKRVKLKPAQNA